MAPGLFHISIDPQDALEEYLRDQLPVRRRRRGAHPQPDLRDGRGGDAGHARAADRRQALGARPARPPHARRRRLRPRRRRRAGDRPRRRGARARRARSPRAAGSGPVARQGKIIDAMLSDPEQIAVIAVARAEELAVTETGALRTALQERMGLPLERVVANALDPDRFSPREATRLEAHAGAPRGGARAARPPPRAAPARAARAAAASSPGRRRRTCRCTPAGRTSSGSPTSSRRSCCERARRIGERLEGKRICIVAGSGGVGKTTASAALALGLAAAGQRVAVVTIDPARRLADSLGLEELGNEPRLRRRRGARGPRHRDARRAVGDDARPQGDVRRAHRQARARRARRATTSSATASTRSCRARSPARRSSARSPSSTSSTATAATTRSCSTRRRRATRWTSSTRPTA